MKRIILTSFIALFAAINVFADEQPDNDTTRYYASKLSQNWFITLNGSANWWQGSDRIPAGNFTTLNGPSLGGEVSFGKWITHNIALRMAYAINGGHSYINGRHINLTHFNFLYGDNPTPITVTQDGQNMDYYKTSFVYHDLHFDVLVSPVDLIQGYYYDRTYTPVIVAGMGLGMVSEHPFVLQSVLKSEAVNHELSFNVGLMNNFRLSRYFDLDLSLMLYGQRWTIDSWTYEYEGVTRPRFCDLNYSTSLGFIWYPGGRVYEFPHNYAKEMNEMRERIKELENLPRDPETVYVHDTIIKFVQVNDTVSEIVSFPLSVFFHKDKYELMSGRDRVNLREIARVAMENGWKIRLRGSCDSATATPSYNQRLSENRCRKVQMELMEFGVPEDQFLLVPVGGVKELDPTEYDRRVLIELVKELK